MILTDGIAGAAAAQMAQTTRAKYTPSFMVYEMGYMGCLDIKASCEISDSTALDFILFKPLIISIYLTHGGTVDVNICWIARVSTHRFEECSHVWKRAAVSPALTRKAQTAIGG